MAELLAAAVPRLPVKANWRRVNLLAYVYPRGIGQAGIALFGGFIRLWRRDRPSAEGLLLHEVAHYKRGGYQVIGLADFLKFIFWLGLASFVVFLGAQAVRIAEQEGTVREEQRRIERQFEALDRQMQEMRAQFGNAAGLDAIPMPERPKRHP